MSYFPGNWNPTLFTLSAVAIGAIFMDDFTPNEQNSIGNWLILVGQVILTNASQEILLKGRSKNGYIDPAIIGKDPIEQELKVDEMEMENIKKAIAKIWDELERLNLGKRP